VSLLGAAASDIGPAVGETLPLTGIRVLDLTAVWAGPFATKQLADLGAQVIKVEGPARLDQTRWLGIPDPDAPEPWNNARYFNEFNRNKLEIGVDTRTDEGREILRKLALASDILIDNFRSGVVERMGLAWDDLHRENPRLIQISMPAYSSIAPESTLPGYGSNVDQMSGMAHYSGYPGGPPHKLGISYGDPVAGLGAAGAALLALWDRETSGEGVRIEVSQRNLLLGLIGEALVGAQRGHDPERRGNRHARLAPQGIYPVRDDRFVALTVADDDEWLRFAALIGRDDLGRRSDLGDAPGRQAAHDELDAAVAAWTAARAAEDVVDAVRAVGIAVAPVATPYDIAADEVLAARGFLAEVPHPNLGTMRISTPTWRFDEGQRTVHRAPLLGEHNAFVLREILGYPDGEIDRLVEAGVLGDRPETAGGAS
jgi:benzylsuccinate CoA-transferase BbsF subunit